MRLVIRSGPGKVELSWMFLPAFCAYDTAMKSALEKELAPKLVGRALDDDLLDQAHDLALDFICRWHRGIPGLRDYLDAVKYVDDTKK